LKILISHFSLIMANNNGYNYNYGYNYSEISIAHISRNTFTSKNKETMFIRCFCTDIIIIPVTSSIHAK